MPNPPTVKIECWESFILDEGSNSTSSRDLDNYAKTKWFFDSEKCLNAEELSNAPSFTAADF